MKVKPVKIEIDDELENFRLTYLGLKPFIC